MKYVQLDLVKSLIKEKQISSIYLDNADMKMLFNVGDKTLSRWRKNKWVVAKKIGGRYYYPLHLLLNMMEEQQ